MRDEAYIESRKPREMFSKLLSDAREFFAAAKCEWEKAFELEAEFKKGESHRTAGVLVQHATGRSPHVAIESALTVAAMNYTTSIELLLKGFVGVYGRFDANSLNAMRNKIRHKSQKVLEILDDIQPECVGELERIHSR